MSLVRNHGKPSIDGTFDLPPDLLRSVGIEENTSTKTRAALNASTID